MTRGLALDLSLALALPRERVGPSATYVGVVRNAPVARARLSLYAVQLACLAAAGAIAGATLA
jgi:hypothetical protein